MVRFPEMLPSDWRNHKPVDRFRALNGGRDFKHHATAHYSYADNPKPQQHTREQVPSKAVATTWAGYVGTAGSHHVALGSSTEPLEICNIRTSRLS